MKTLKAWEKSGLNITDYLTEPCRINEELYYYIAESTSPSYSNSNVVQSGEAERSEGDWNELTLWYMTVSQIDGKFFYLGVLPEFEKSE